MNEADEPSMGLGDDKRTLLMVDGQPVGTKKQSLTVLLHQEDMVIDAPGYVVIDPETTLKICTLLTQEDWDKIRAHKGFLGAWGTLWKGQEPPKVLAKAGLASRHVTGMILSLVQCKAEGKSPHLKYPETYLHPAQCAAIVTLVHFLGFGK